MRQEGTSGLYQMGVRYYDAVTARFLSRDPQWPKVENWAALNPYLYAMANPVSYVDPMGRQGGTVINFTKQLLQWKERGETIGKAAELALKATTANNGSIDLGKEKAEAWEKAKKDIADLPENFKLREGYKDL